MNIKRNTIITALILIITIPAIIISCTNPLQDIIRADIIEAAALQLSSQPPVAPSDLTATAMSPSQIDLTWLDNSDNETGFDVQRKLATATEWQTVETIGADSTTYSDTDLTAGTEYTFRVRASNEGGNSDWTEEVNKSTISLSAPAAPSTPDLAAADDSGYSDSDNITNKTTDLTFSGTSEADTTVSLYSDIDDYLGEFTTTTGNWLLDVTLTEGTHLITAKATKKGENSAPSEALSVIVDTTSPGIPSILKPMQGTNTGINLRPTFTWTTVSDDSLFEVQADNNPNFSSPNYTWNNLSGSSYTPGTNMSISGTQPVGTRYYLRMREVDIAGNTGNWSNSGMLRYINVGRFDDDFNGDGYSDVIVGANGNATNGDLSGAAYIYYGGSSMSSTANLTIYGLDTNYRFGSSVASAGDINGDGYTDVIVGAWGIETAYIYYGSSSISGVADIIINGEELNYYFGISVASAGDLNSDSYSDIIVGAYGSSSETGAAYIYYGGSSISDTADISIYGEADGDQFGRCVSAAGDLNGDSYSDIIVGAYCNSSATGAAYIYYGGTSIGVNADVSLYGVAEEDEFGNSVASAGDLNGDGYGDVIVGASGYDYETLTNSGAAYIYYGGASISTTANISLYGETTTIHFGESVTSAGDYNGDGYADVIVGASGYDYDALINSGAVYIYYGGSSMNNTTNLTMYGDSSFAGLGNSVASAGDLNMDGYEDVVVGASWYTYNNLNSCGAAYIYYGNSLAENTADLIIYGETEGDHFGWSVD